MNPYKPVFRDDLCRKWHELYQGWLSLADQHRKENLCRTQTPRSIESESR